MRWGLQRAAARARSLRPGRRWLVLGLAVAAQIASLSALFGVAFVIPELRQAYGITVARAGTLAGLPSLGLLLTLLGWGVLIDRYGERLTMAVSLGHRWSSAVFPLVDTALGAGLVLFGVGGRRSSERGQRPSRHGLVRGPGTRPGHGTAADRPAARHGAVGGTAAGPRPPLRSRCGDAAARGPGRGRTSAGGQIRGPSWEGCRCGPGSGCPAASAGRLLALPACRDLAGPRGEHAVGVPQFTVPRSRWSTWSTSSRELPRRRGRSWPRCTCPARQRGSGPGLVGPGG